MTRLRQYRRMPVGNLVDRYGKQRAIAPRLSGGSAGSPVRFLEVAYIMLNGDAPDEASYQTFRETITRHTLVHEQIARMCSGFRRDSHPMALMCALVGALAAFYHDVLDVENPQHRALAATRLLSKMPTIAAMSYKYTIEQPAAYPRNDLSYAGNFLQMLFAIPAEKYVLNPVIEQAMNQILVLHADHGQCASTTTVRAAGSSGANLFACVAAGLASLWGPMHGGANESSMRMLEEIESVDQVPAFLRQAKRDPQAFRRLGFGNSRYRHRDPRADILRETSHRVLAEVGMSDRLLQVAMALEDVALTDPYFVDNGLSPSVDFYTAVILKAMNLPSSMFAVVTAVGRTVGWVAHWNEMHGAADHLPATADLRWRGLSGLRLPTRRAVNGPAVTAGEANASATFVVTYN